MDLVSVDSHMAIDVTERLKMEPKCCGLTSSTDAPFRYKEWKGNNKFLCGGRLVLGVHVSHLNTSLLLLILSWAEYAFLVIPFLNDPRLYLIPLAGGTINIALLFCTAFTDPGILPRQHFQGEHEDKTNAIRRDAMILKSNFCRICNVWRPYRARHCKYCDNCVDIFDHHCPWTGTCIGIRNYPQFLLFIISVWLGATVVLLSAVYILLSWAIAGATTDRYYLRILTLAVTIPWTLLILFAVGSLLSFHLFLIFRGQTTNEYFRERRARQQAPSTPVSPTGPAAALSPSEAAAQRLMDNNADTVEAMIAPAGGTRCLKMILWKAGNTGTPPVTTTNGSTENVTDNSSTRATIGSHHTSPHNSGMLEGLELPPAGSNTRTISRTRDFYDSSYAVDQVLTPLYDVDSTPFPQLSPSPRSPRRIQRNHAAKYTPLRLELEEPNDNSLIAAGSIDSANVPFSDVCNAGSPPSLSPVGKDHFDSLSPENTILLQQMRADLAQHRRNLTIGIGSGAHTQEPSLTLIFPPPAPPDKDALPEKVLLTTRENVKRPNKLELLRSRKEQRSLTVWEQRSQLSTLACLPCGAVACALRLCGCLHPLPPSTAQANVRNGHRIVPLSPTSPRVSVNMRYTYHYLCCVLPIIPRSKLLPLWHRVNEEDDDQQQYLLEVLLEKIHEAQRWDDEMENEHSV